MKADTVPIDVAKLQSELFRGCLANIEHMHQLESRKLRNLEQLAPALLGDRVWVKPEQLATTPHVVFDRKRLVRLRRVFRAVADAAWATGPTPSGLTNRQRLEQQMNLRIEADAFSYWLDAEDAAVLQLTQPVARALLALLVPRLCVDDGRYSVVLPLYEQPRLLAWERIPAPPPPPSDAQTRVAMAAATEPVTKPNTQEA